MKHYSFETSKGTVDFDWERGTDWSRLNPRYDVEVNVDGSWKDWDDSDCGEVEDMFQWLLDQGVKFECPSSLLFNIMTMGDELDDSSRTEMERLSIIENLGEDGCRRRVDDYYYFDLDPECDYACKPFTVTSYTGVTTNHSISDQRMFWYASLEQADPTGARIDSQECFFEMCNRIDHWSKKDEGMVVWQHGASVLGCYQREMNEERHRIIHDYIPNYDPMA